MSGSPVPGDPEGCRWFAVTGHVVPEDAPTMRNDNVIVYYNPPMDQAPAIVASVRDRTAAAGWQIHLAPATSTTVQLCGAGWL